MYLAMAMLQYSNTMRLSQWSDNDVSINIRFSVYVFFLRFDIEMFYFLRLSHSFRFHPQHTAFPIDPQMIMNIIFFFNGSRFLLHFSLLKPDDFFLSIDISAHCFLTFSLSTNMTEFVFIWGLRMAFLPTFSKC